MKDIVISGKRQKRELGIYIGCLLFAYLLNIIAIILFETDWNELWTQTFWMLIIGTICYGISIGLRLLFYIIKRIFVKKTVRRPLYRSIR